MFVNLQRFFLLTIGFLFFMLGCGPDSNDILLGVSDLIQSSLREEENVARTEAADVAPVSNAQVSFERDLQPILSARCAFAGCHVAGGPHGLNFSTYESFIRGGNDGPVFTPGNARSSDIVEEIVSGRMPVGGPRLSNAQIQLFRDWINQQDRADFPNLRYDDDADDDHDHDDHDDDHDHDHDDHDDDHDDHDDHDDD